MIKAAFRIARLFKAVHEPAPAARVAGYQSGIPSHTSMGRGEGRATPRGFKRNHSKRPGMSFGKLKERLSSRLFLFLVLYLFILNLPFFLNMVFYLHDSLFSFMVFHVLYTDFFFNRELMQWLPFSTYGVQGDFPQMLISISNYSVGLAAGLLKIRDVLLLYRISIFLEELIFLSGVYMLAKDMFRSRAAVAFACLSAAGGIFLTVQIVFNFRAYCLLPMMIYFVRLFFVRNKPQYLLLAANIVILSIPGNTPYFFETVSLELFIVFAVLFIHHRRGLGKLLDLTRRDLLLTAFLLASAFALTYSFFYTTFHLNDFLKNFSEGRDHLNLKTPLRTFLTYGGQIGWGKFTELIWPDLLDFNEDKTLYIGKDMTLFIGLLPLPFVLYGILKASKDPMLRALTAAVVIMGLFSLGGAVSKAFYHIVPGMAYYRHIGLSVGSFKVFLPLMAGFGVDRLLEDRNAGSYLVHAVTASVILLAGAYMYYTTPVGADARTVAAVYFFLLLSMILVFFVTGRKFSRAHFSAFLIAGVSLEMLGYQAVLTARYYNLAKTALRPGFGALEQPRYQSERSLRLPVKNADNYNFLKDVAKADEALYSFYYNFLQYEPCASNLRTDFMNSYAARLISARGGEIRLFYFNLPQDGWLLDAIGCNSPKLKLVTDVIFTKDAEDALDAVRRMSDTGGAVVLNNVPEGMRRSWTNHPGSMGEIKVTDFYGNGIELDAVVPDEEGAWLYYADSYHPAWQAYVNGSPVPVFQSNYGFKSVMLKKGENRVKFIYNNKKAAAVYVMISGGVVFMLYFLKILYGLCMGET